MTTTDPLDVAFVVGGHPFDARATLDAFDALDGIDVYPQDLPTFAYDTGDDLETYDAVVLYTYHGHGYAVDLTDEAAEKAHDALRRAGDAGVGLVVLHHGLAAFPDSEEWAALCGVSGRTLSGVSFDESVRATVADPDHPVTRGLDDFEVVDETYAMAEPDADSRVLLETDHPASMDALAWTRRYRDARVFCYQSGHGASALGDPSVRTVLARAVRWAGGRDDVDAPGVE